MNKKATKPYPFIKKKNGILNKVVCFYGRCYLRECDKNGKIFKRNNVVKLFD